MKIAVYGTLREGYNNNTVLGDSVKVYEVTDRQLPQVDRLEGYNPANHGGSWYKRLPTDIVLDDGNEIEASVYFNEEEGSELIKTGDYADYR